MAIAPDYSQLQTPQNLSFEQARNLAELMTVYMTVNFENNGDYQRGLDDMARRIQRDGLEASVNWTFKASPSVSWRATVEPYKTPEAEARALVERLYKATNGSTAHFNEWVKAAQLRTPSETVAYWNDVNKEKPKLLATIPQEELASLDEAAAANRTQVVNKDLNNFIQSANQIYAGKDITPNYDPSMDASKIINDRLAQFGYKANQADIDRWNENARRYGVGTTIAKIDRTLGLLGFDRAITSSGTGEEFRGVALSGQLPSTYPGSSLYRSMDYTGVIGNPLLQQPVPQNQQPVPQNQPGTAAPAGSYNPNPRSGGSFSSGNFGSSTQGSTLVVPEVFDQPGPLISPKGLFHNPNPQTYNEKDPLGFNSQAEQMAHMKSLLVNVNTPTGAKRMTYGDFLNEDAKYAASGQKGPLTLLGFVGAEDKFKDVNLSRAYTPSLGTFVAATPSEGPPIPVAGPTQPVPNQDFIQSNLGPMTPITAGGPVPPPAAQTPTAQVPLPTALPQPLRGTLPASFANLPQRPVTPPLPTRPMFESPTQLLQRVQQEDAAKQAALEQAIPQEQTTDEFIRRQNEIPGFLRKFADGGSVGGASSGIRRLKMSGYQDGGDVSNDEYIQQMMSGIDTEGQPTSPVDTAVSDFISSRSKLFTDPKQFLDKTYENIKQEYGDINKDPKAMEAFLMDNLGFGGLTAYHGGPKLFKQFDPSKRGTGEGFQQYGVGSGYAAEARPVAEGYRRYLGGDSGIRVGNKKLETFQKTLRKELDQAQTAKDQMMVHDKADLLTMVTSSKPSLFGRKSEEMSPQEILKEVKSGGTRQYDPRAVEWLESTVIPNLKYPGYLYKGDIPDEIIPTFLDWDKPLSQQTKEVRGVLEKDPIFQEVQDPRKWSEYSGGFIQMNLFKDSQPGKNISGEDLYKFLSLKLESDQAATDYLDKLGLRGIRYLDEYSRGKEKGTSNFVVFRPEDYKVEEINDLPLEEWIKQGKIPRKADGGEISNDEVFNKTPKSQELANQIRALFEQLETPSPSSEEEYLKRRPTPESKEPIRSRKAMEAFLLAANPRMEIEERPLPGGKLGFVRADDPDTLVLSTRQFPAQREETAFHELEHSLALRGGNPLGKLTREGKPITMDNNYRFDILYNRDGKSGGEGRYARYDIIRRMIDNKDKIEKFFGRPIDSNYFSREPEGGLLAEQFADLSALEQVTNKSITRDPEMRKLLFPDDKAAAVYDAITGLRQTRLDAKDRPPYTPDYPEEKGIMDWIRGKLGMEEK